MSSSPSGPPHASGARDPKPATSRFLLVVACAACFGSGLTVSRLGLRHFDAVTYTGLRFVVAATAFAMFLLVQNLGAWPRDRRFWVMTIAFGVVGTAMPMLAIVSALQFVSSGTAAIVAAASPTFSVIFAHFALQDEKITVRKVAGIGVAFAGAAYLVLQRETGLGVAATHWGGYALILGGLALSHGAIVSARRFLRGYNVFQVVGVQMFTAAIVLLPFALGRFSAERITGVREVGVAVFAVTYGGVIGTFAAFLGRFAIIKRFGATDAALIDYVVPIMATAGGVAFLAEKLTITMAIGMAIILLGVRIVQMPPRKVSTSS